jgi:hypothetical protein
VKVTGSHLERADSLVRQLESMECEEHAELSEVGLIVAQDRSAQTQLIVLCCDAFRSKVTATIDVYNSLSSNERCIQSWVESEMRSMHERGTLVATKDRDHDRAEVMIQRGVDVPWLRFYVDPHAPEEEARRVIRVALGGDGEMREVKL